MRLIDADQLLDFIRFDERVIAPEEHTTQDIVMMIQTAPAISPTPNDPLTLEELREMDGDPVFIVSKRYGNGWCIVQWHGVSKSWMYFSRTGTAEGMTATPITAREYGDDWSAYRRKPED